TPDASRVQALFRELEFYGLLRELPAVLGQVGVPYLEQAPAEEVGAGAAFELPPTEIVKEPAAFEKLLARIRDAERVALRLAAPEEKIHFARPAGVALAFPGEAGAY